MATESIIHILPIVEYMKLPDRKVRVEEIWIREEYSNAAVTSGEAHCESQEFDGGESDSPF